MAMPWLCHGHVAKATQPIPVINHPQYNANRTTNKFALVVSKGPRFKQHSPYLPPRKKYASCNIVSYNCSVYTPGAGEVLSG